MTSPDLYTALTNLVRLYKITPTYVKRTLAENPDNEYALAWQGVLHHIKQFEESQ